MIKARIIEVLVEGFKSYKDQTRTEPFSNKLNTIVGANGAGKSNFFQAIRFVLDAETSSLRQEERQKLLHEGAGHAVLSAFVEIVLDNSDGRIQIEKDEVRLRRTVGLKKDEYQLNKKKITKTEVSDILESAGFSKANPYYVVQQGKIMALSMMKDEERLDLLKEIGGSKVYEDRRKESLKVIQDADGRTQQIAELVSEMEAKLKQLDAERDELAKYQAIDRECRSLEYAIHDKEVSDARTKLEEIEQQRQEEAERAGKALDEREAAHAALKKTERELKQVNVEQKKEQANLREVSSSKTDAQSRKAQLDLDVADLEDQREAGTAAEAQCRKEARTLEKEIAHAEKRLEGVRKTLDERQEKVSDLQRSLNEAQRRQEALETKQGHRQNFATIKERDDHLKRDMKLKEDGKRKLQDQIQDLQGQIQNIEASKSRLGQDIEAKKREVKQLQQKCKEFPSLKRELEAKRNGLQDQRKEGQRREDDLKEKQKLLLDSVKKLISKVDPGNHAHQRALSCVKRLSEAHKIPVHGTVLELIDPIPQLCLATEVAAGGALFHLVVDTDEQASNLLRRLKEAKEQGRVTCLPLNKLQVESVQYPDRFGTDALPLTKYLTYSADVKKAIEQVFGRWMICKDSETASKVIAITDKISCVTIAGDVHARKGTITGGHRDTQRVKLQAYKQKIEEDKELDKIRVELEDIAQNSGHFENEITAVLGNIDRLILAYNADREALQRLEGTIQADREQLVSLEAAINSKQKAIADNEEMLELYTNQIADVQAQLGTKELGKLTAAEVKESHQLKDDLLQWQNELKKAQELLDESETLHAEVHGTLTNNLLKRKAELEAQISSLAVSEIREALQAKKQEAAEVGAAMKKLQEQESKAQQAVDGLQQKTDDLNAEAERLRELQKSGSADDGSNAMTQLLAKRSTLLQKKADHEKKIRELGSLPMDAFEKFQGKSLSEVNKLLVKAQKQLKKYGHVNKKALDQYMSFTNQKEELVMRHDETMRGKEKIQQLILNLDLRKDEAIERTFKGVAKNFREIFAELAPGGKGELVMQKATQKAAADVEEAEPANETNERYSGVKVKVSFGAGDTMSLKQLSGGQKTLVALALIFSIQRLDPAPFYLFDEIDAALDPAYRSTVAKMLARQANDPSNPSQFIITTFHPQIVHESDQVYGVSHSARISTIDAITKEDALEFLNAEEKAAATEQD